MNFSRSLWKGDWAHFSILGPLHFREKCLIDDPPSCFHGILEKKCSIDDRPPHLWTLYLRSTSTFIKMYKEGGGIQKGFFLGQTQVMLCVKTMDQLGKIAWFSKKSKNLAASLSGAQQGYNDHFVGNFRHAPHHDMRSD